MQGDDEDSMDEHVGDGVEWLPYLSDEPSRKARAVLDLLEDGEQELYPGCLGFSKLSFLVRLYHIKCMCRVSDKTFCLILELLGNAFQHAKILKTLHDAKRIIRKLGIEYKKIYACPNDCMLYQGSNQDLSRCKQCGASSKTAVDMLWHKRGTNSNGSLRHPRDGEAWKAFDRRYTDFSDNPRSNTYGGRACPTCNLDAETRRLTFSQKWCFMGHRRFLNHDHRYRQDWSRFDGKVEDRSLPFKMTGRDILRQLEGVLVSHGKVQAVSGKKRRGHQIVFQDESPWKKSSIFFDLPYWENNELRHNLDVMHIEKNVCDNIVFTMLNESGKSKHHLKARKDLQLMGIKHDMWPLEG
ncbi:uncharacterized protein LOC110275761 [Arachis duranensis]|uniref:Uncharacterized protein LOC110275761 n=1 Tax=Arachis duranensis TaxID=130453 RepID=A0A6P5MS93_ARADU|nr:uncharacterized protein LOC110275761 [Arachis duranensis]